MRLVLYQSGDLHYEWKVVTMLTEQKSLYQISVTDVVTKKGIRWTRNSISGVVSPNTKAYQTPPIPSCHLLLIQASATIALTITRRLTVILTILDEIYF